MDGRDNSPAKVKQALQIYEEMGPGRSMKKLIEETGLSYATLYKWSAKYNWKAKVKRYDDAEFKRVSLENEKKQRENYALAIDVAREGIIKFRNNMKYGSAHITTAKEYKMLADSLQQISESLRELDLARAKLDEKIKKDETNNNDGITFNLNIKQGDKNEDSKPE